MARRGRKQAREPSYKTNIYINSENYAYLKLFHTDPLTGRFVYGDISALVNQLLREHFRSKHGTPTTVPSEDEG